MLHNKIGPWEFLNVANAKLVDLPGLQDSNSARNVIVNQYIMKCTGFIIAARIERAVDNRTAKDLLGRQFRRQLLMVS